MGRKKIYSEDKRRIDLTLTETAIKWLRTKQVELAATSLSDAIERMAREQNEVPCLPDNEKDQTLKLNSEDSEALVETLFNPPSPNKALLAAAARCASRL